MQKDPTLPDSIILGQFTGLKNTVTPERLTATELERAINVDIDDSGQIRRRRGYERKATGSFHSLCTIGDKVLVVRDGALSTVSPGYAFTHLAMVGEERLSYAAVGEEIYFSSRLTNGVIVNGAVQPWGKTGGQGDWHSPVLDPTATLGEVAGKLLGDPPLATEIAAYKGRIYLAVGKVLWATELYQYHYVDRTRGFMQFEHDITMLAAMDDGLYVGTEGGLYFLKGVFGQFVRSAVLASPVLAGSVTSVPIELVHPNARQGPMPTGEAAVFMTRDGICAGFDGGTCYNLTSGTMVFPEGDRAAALFRQDSGVNSYVAAVDSGGTPSASVRIGDYVDAEIVRRFQGGTP